MIAAVKVRYKRIVTRLKQWRCTENREACRKTAVQYGGTKGIAVLLSAVCNKLSGNTDRTSTLTPDGDSVRFASEGGDVLLQPLQREPLVLGAQVCNTSIHCLYSGRKA